MQGRFEVQRAEVGARVTEDAEDKGGAQRRLHLEEGLCGW